MFIIKNKAYLCVFLVFFGACRTLSGVVSPQVSFVGKTKVLETDFTYLQARAKVHYQDRQENFKSAVEVRIKKDSAIWLSFRPALNVEAVRVLMTQDSMKMIDRMNDRDTAYSFKDLQQKLRVDIDFSLLQAVLVGNLLKKNANLRLTTPKDSSYLLHQQIRNLEIISTINSQQKIIHVALKDQISNSNGEVDYQNFQPVATVLFPFAVTALLRYKDQDGMNNTASIEINYSKVDFPKKPLRFPF
jgi:hypothetical protein